MYLETKINKELYKALEKYGNFSKDEMMRLATIKKEPEGNTGKHIFTRAFDNLEKQVPEFNKRMLEFKHLPSN